MESETENRVTMKPIHFSAKLVRREYIYFLKSVLFVTFWMCCDLSVSPDVGFVHSLLWSCRYQGQAAIELQCELATLCHCFLVFLLGNPSTGSCLVFSLQCLGGRNLSLLLSGLQNPSVWSSGRWLVAWWARLRITCKYCLIDICQNRRINCILCQALLCFTLWTHLTKAKDLPLSLLWIYSCCTVLHIKDESGRGQWSFLVFIDSQNVLGWKRP